MLMLARGLRRVRAGRPSQRHYRITAFHLPQLSPSMTDGAIVEWHAQPHQAIDSASMLMTLTTRSLLADTVTEHVMEVECHDSGVIGSLDTHVTGTSIPINTVVGFMFDDQSDYERHRDQIPLIEKILKNPEQSRSEVKELTITPFLWQAYVKAGERQNGPCVPTGSSREAGDMPHPTSDPDRP